MDTPEPVENARESFGMMEYDVDNSVSHVILREPITGYNDEVIIPEGEELKIGGIDYYDGEWSVTLFPEGESTLRNSHTINLSEYEVEWVYKSEIPEKAQEAEELLEEAQSLLDNIWGESGDVAAEELTKRVRETRNKLDRNYL